MHKNEVEKQLEIIAHLLSKADRLSGHCEQNMNRLNSMMNELKGLIAMVRPSAKKNDWYGKELNISGEEIREIQLVIPKINED